MAIECDKWEWRDLFASKYGPPDPSTRLVLFVILTHLYGDSKSTFPGQKRIAEYSGLSTKSVGRHLEAATKKGWLRRHKNKRRGKIGIWYEYFPTIPKRLRERISRGDILSHREKERPDILSPRLDTVSLTTGKIVPVDGTPCPTNQGLNQASKQVLNPDGDRNVVNDVPRLGIEWAEALGAAKDIGFRQPGRTESAKSYMAAIKQTLNQPACPEVKQLIRRKAAEVDGVLKIVPR